MGTAVECLPIVPTERIVKVFGSDVDDVESQEVDVASRKLRHRGRTSYVDVVSKNKPCSNVANTCGGDDGI